MTAFPGVPRLVELPAGAVFARTYDRRHYADGVGFRFFGPHGRDRWDHHPAGPPSRHVSHGVLYLTTSLRCAVAEVFGDARRVAPSPSQRLAVVGLTRPVVVADTRGLAAVELGVPTGALRTRDRALTQNIARRLHSQTAAAGVLYEGWHTGETCLCLTERAVDAVELVDDRDLADPAVAADVAVIADELHYACAHRHE